MVYQKRACTFMRTLAKTGEVWRTLANPHDHTNENLPDIHQSSGEGPHIHQDSSEGAFCMRVAFRIQLARNPGNSAHGNH